MPPKFIKCEICGNKATRLNEDKRTFMAKFPLDEARCKQWVKVAGKEDLVYVPIEKLHSLKYVCGDHFENRAFNKKKSRLRKKAVPTRNLKAEALPDEMLNEFPCRIYTNGDDSMENDPRAITNKCPTVIAVEIIGGPNETVQTAMDKLPREFQNESFSVQQQMRKAPRPIIIPRSQLPVLITIHNVPFHRFPNPDKRPELFTAWVSAVSVNIGENNPQKIYKNKRICDHHFETKFKTTGGRLVWSAVPTIFDRVKLSINIVVDIEHNYCHSRRESSHATLLSDVTNIQNDLNKTGPSTSSVICHPHVSQSKFDSGTIVHIFPNPTKFPERFRELVRIVGGNLETPADYEYYKKKRLCDIHFKDEHKTSCHRLSAIAVPCLYLPEKEKPDESISMKPVRSTFAYTEPKRETVNEVLEDIEEDVEDYSTEVNSESTVYTVNEQQEGNFIVRQLKTELLACRCCLATEVKLYDLEKANLKDAIEDFVGCKISDSDNDRMFICACCATLLMKCIEFRERCRRADALVQKLRSVDMLKTNFVKSIDRPYYNLNMNLSISDPILMGSEEFDEEMTSEGVNVKVEGEECVETEMEDVPMEMKQEQVEDNVIEDNVIEDNVMEESDGVLYEADMQEVDCQEDADEQEDDENCDDVDDGEYAVEYLDFSQSRSMFRPDVYEKEYNMEVTCLTPEQQELEVQSRKLSSNYLKSNHRCELCGKGFLSDEKLVNHYNSMHHPDIGDHVCALCTARFNNKTKLSCHMFNHKYRFQCKLCNFNTTRRWTAKSHHFIHQGIRFECEQCSKIFNRKTSYLSHLRIHHPNEEVWCRYCGESFISDSGLRTHRRLMHTNVIEFICAKCGEAFLNSEALAVHNNGECSEFPCARCGESFNDEKLSKVHVLARHSKSLGILRKCEVCNKLFKNPSALKRHYEVTSGVCLELSPCPQCGDSFESEELLQMHVIGNHEKVEVPCQSCNRTFASGREYSIHYQRAHVPKKSRRLTSLRRWGVVVGEEGVVIAPQGEDDQNAAAQPLAHGAVVCEICGKTCANIVHLKHHQRTHSGEKPYECTVCCKRFAMPTLLKEHMRVHTGERPHVCSYCSKTFKSKSAVNRHTLTHTGERKHICQICNKDFLTSSDVKTHIKTVHMKITGPPRIRRPKIQSA